MSNQISDLPPESNAGLEFDYSVWTANTKVTLTNVNWDNTYRDFAYMDGQVAVNAHIDSLPDNLNFSDFANVRVSEPVNIPTPFNAASRYNYLRASAPVKPTSGGDDIQKDYYYFIIGVVEDSPESTRLILQLDVLTTYVSAGGVKIRSAFLQRGHKGIANANRMQRYGRDYLSIPEGLDVGSMYVSMFSAQLPYMSAVDNESGTAGYDVLVCSTTDLQGPWWTDGTLTVPVKRAAPGGTFSGLPSGASYYVFKGSTAFKAFMEAVSGAPHVAQGIISITVIPNVIRYFPSYTYGDTGNGLGGIKVAPSGMPGRMNHAMYANWRQAARETLPAKYQHLDKFLTSPYCMVELTTQTGTPVFLRPEHLQNPDLEVTELVNLVPPTQRIVFVPKGYGALTDDAAAFNSEWLAAASIVGQFPTLAGVNDGALLYMASNSGALAYQKESIGWARDKALRSAENSYDQSTKGIATSGALAEQGIANATAQQGINAQYAWAQSALGAVSGIGQAGLSGAVAGPGGAALGAGMATVGAGFNALGTAVDLAKQADMLAQSTANTREVQSIQTGNAEYMRDTTKALAEWGANGDYEMAQASRLAQIQDASLTPNSMVGQVGGEAFNLINGEARLIARIKMPDAGTIRKIGDYWLRYGYAVDMFTDVPDDFACMTRFTYWKLSETYLTNAPMPEVHKNAIRGAFEKGITVWRDPARIGNFTDNLPLEGITL